MFPAVLKKEGERIAYDPMTKFIVEIAVTASGKVSKKQMKAWVADALEAQRTVINPSVHLSVTKTAVRKVDID